MHCIIALQVMKQAKSLTIDLFFLLEAQAADEFPEKILG